MSAPPWLTPPGRFVTSEGHCGKNAQLHSLLKSTALRDSTHSPTRKLGHVPPNSLETLHIFKNLALFPIGAKFKFIE